MALGLINLIGVREHLKLERERDLVLDFDGIATLLAEALLRVSKSVQRIVGETNLQLKAQHIRQHLDAYLLGSLFAATSIAAVVTLFFGEVLFLKAVLERMLLCRSLGRKEV